MAKPARVAAGLLSRRPRLSAAGRAASSAERQQEKGLSQREGQEGVGSLGSQRTSQAATPLACTTQKPDALVLDGGQRSSRGRSSTAAAVARGPDTGLWDTRSPDARWGPDTGHSGHWALKTPSPAGTFRNGSPGGAELMVDPQPASGPSPLSATLCLLAALASPSGCAAALTRVSRHRPRTQEPGPHAARMG